MWRTIGFASLTAGFLAFLPADVTAQKKSLEVADAATDTDYKQIQKVKDMTGKLASVNTMSITFRLDIPHLEPNPNYRPPKGGGNNNQYQQMQNIYRQQAQAMAIKNPLQRQMKMQQLMGQLQNQQYKQMMQASQANSNPNNQPFRLAHQYRDYELDLSEKVVIRKMVLEQEFDDKGNVKTYTKSELADLKGKDTTKPGYTAKIEDLQSSQQVKIYLAMPKKKPAEDKTEDKAAEKDKAAPAADKAKVVDKADPVADKAKKTDKADAPEKAKEEIVKPLITMIVILQALDAPLSTDITPAKKKNAN